MYFLSTWIGALLARMRGKRVLMWSHGFLKPESGPKGFLRRTFYRLAHCMLLYGHRGQRIMADYGFPLRGLRVIFNSLDYEQQRRVRDSTPKGAIEAERATVFLHSAAPVVFFVGRLTQRKRLDLLVGALERLHQDGRQVNLLLIGGGPAEQELRALVAAAGLADWTVFKGPCYEESTLGRYILLGDICVSPGEVGLTAIHSMAYGRPVITHDDFDHQGPEFEAIVPNETGDFFAAGDVQSLAAAIWKWAYERRFMTAELACIRMVEQRYNPNTQVTLINQAVHDLAIGL